MVKALEGLPGVKKVEADWEKGQAVLTIQAGSFKTIAVQTALQAAKFGGGSRVP